MNKFIKHKLLTKTKYIALSVLTAFTVVSTNLNTSLYADPELVMTTVLDEPDPSPTPMPTPVPTPMPTPTPTPDPTPMPTPTPTPIPTPTIPPRPTAPTISVNGSTASSSTHDLASRSSITVFISHPQSNTYVSLRNPNEGVAMREGDWGTVTFHSNELAVGQNTITVFDRESTGDRILFTHTVNVINSALSATPAPGVGQAPQVFIQSNPTWGWGGTNVSNASITVRSNQAGWVHVLAIPQGQATPSAWQVTHSPSASSMVNANQNVTLTLNNINNWQNLTFFVVAVNNAGATSTVASANLNASTNVATSSVSIARAARWVQNNNNLADINASMNTAGILYLRVMERTEGTPTANQIINAHNAQAFVNANQVVTLTSGRIDNGRNYTLWVVGVAQNGMQTSVVSSQLNANANFANNGHIDITLRGPENQVLQNTVFNIHNAQNTLVATSTTNSNGRLSINSLAPGNYRISNATFTFNITVTAGQTTTGLFNAQWASQPTNNNGNINIIIVTPEQQIINGASFGIYNPSNVRVATASTNSLGRLSANNLSPANYTLRSNNFTLNVNVTANNTTIGQFTALRINNPTPTPAATPVPMPVATPAPIATPTPTLPVPAATISLPVPAPTLQNSADAADHWAAEYILISRAGAWVLEYPGDMFHPDSNATRAVFAHMIVQAFGLEMPQNQAPASFNDVPDGHPAQNSIKILATHGIIQGTGGGNFNPNGDITREQAATMIVNTARVLNFSIPATGYTFVGNEYQKFIDSYQVSSWAQENVSIAASHNIITGHPNNTFAPADSVTRAQSIVMAIRAIQNFR